MCRLSWFLDPGGWGKATAVGLYFIFPGICTLSLEIRKERSGTPEAQPQTGKYLDTTTSKEAMMHTKAMGVESVMVGKSQQQEREVVGQIVSCFSIDIERYHDQENLQKKAFSYGAYLKFQRMIVSQLFSPDLALYFFECLYESFAAAAAAILKESDLLNLYASSLNATLQ
ncbi:hypothetical protein STEG23_003558 [Scotinomys teguina]